MDEAATVEGTEDLAEFNSYNTPSDKKQEVNELSRGLAGLALASPRIATSKSISKVFLLYHQGMMAHKKRDCSEVSPPHEVPERVEHIYDVLTKELKNHFIEIDCPMATEEEILLVHSKEHYDKEKAMATATDAELNNREKENKFGDMVYCNETFNAASLAVGSVLESIRAVTAEDAKSTRAIVLKRPPGHHAGACEAHGFCHFNSIGCGAVYAIKNGLARRVLIFDWDFHHGNGTQNLTYDNKNIFFVSIHAYRDGVFLGTGHPHEVSDGTNLNIAIGGGVRTRSRLDWLDMRPEGLLVGGLGTAVHGSFVWVAVGPELGQWVFRYDLLKAKDRPKDKAVVLSVGGIEGILFDKSYDLLTTCKDIGEGKLHIPELLGDVHIDPITAEGAYDLKLDSNLVQNRRLLDLLQRYMNRKSFSAGSQY